MNTIPRVADRDLAILKEKKIVLYSVNDNLTQIYKLFKHAGFEVVACCLESKTSRIKIFKNRLMGIPYIHPKAFFRVVRKYDNVIVQGVDVGSEKNSMIERLKELNVEVSELNAVQLATGLNNTSLPQEFKKMLKYKWRAFIWRCKCEKRTSLRWIRFKRKQIENPIVVCMPPKTADTTLINTFKEVNARKLVKQVDEISYINLLHLSRMIDRKECTRKWKTLKIIVGLREPISQNLSRLYEDLSRERYLANWLLGDLEGKTFAERKVILERYEKLLAGDIQNLWDAYIERFIYSNQGAKRSAEPKTVQAFLQDFQKYVLDITAYPFNQEKGYTIIKDDNIEVFVYQLEKLNNLVPELSAWVGVPFDKLENGNQASDKWIAASYKQAQKEIEFTQEYFDKCFNEPYVKHCYSEADIEKFKARWRPHIKKDA